MMSETEVQFELKIWNAVLDCSRKAHICENELATPKYVVAIIKKILEG